MKRSLFGIVLPAVLLSAFFAQTVGGMRFFNASSDETSHLPSGYTYLVTGDLRLNQQHPPLMKMLCAAPLLALRPALDLEDEHWKSDPPRSGSSAPVFSTRMTPTGCCSGDGCR